MLRPLSELPKSIHMINLSYPKLLKLFPDYIDPKRSESASFLIWYLENYLRLDSADAVDAVCDQSGDKGVDGIYINEDAGCVEIYQSKIAQKEGATIGDTALKEFAGTLTQFSNEKTIRALISSAGDANVGLLAKRLELEKRISELEIKGYFISNINLDKNGESILKSLKNIKFIGRKELESTYVDPSRTTPVSKSVKFDISGLETAKYIVDSDNEALIAPLKASELISLEGIVNQSLFAYNVRGSLGRTQVNKDISSSIKASAKHKLFPLFHNGITIVASSVDRPKSESYIKISDYFVVNGCQSLSALFENKNSITPNLRVLTKIVRAAPGSDLAEMVTRFSNNQNGMKSRDFKSNNKIQIRIQNEMAISYSREFFYEIKRGENNEGKEIIANETAGLYLMAFDLKQPWGTHRKYQVFEELHPEIFGRPAVTAHRIVLCHIICAAINDKIKKISNGLVAKYALTRYLLLYIVRLILEKDKIGLSIIENPPHYTLDKNRRAALKHSISNILEEVITDLNAEVDQLGDEFDYRGRLRDEKWANKLAHEVVSTHQKLVNRRRTESFESLFNSLIGKSGKRKSTQ